jgi:hypothetical protein
MDLRVQVLLNLDNLKVSNPSHEDDTARTMQQDR